MGSPDKPAWRGPTWRGVVLMHVMVLAGLIYAVTWVLWQPSFIARRTSTKATSCNRFVILTSTRSGSNYLLSFLGGHAQMNVAWEAFNMQEGQSGHDFLWAAQLTVAQVPVIGARAWANIVFDELQASTKIKSLQRGSACAVGFKLKDTYETFPLDQYQEFLRTPGVRFIILERYHTYAQYVSFQRICWTGNWGGPGDPNYERDHAITLDHLAKKEPCGGGWAREYETFQATKEYQYKIYRNLTHGAKVLHIATESLGIAQPKVEDFLLNN